MKARCYTQILEYELVRITTASLDFSIQKKLVNQQVRDMAQLAKRVRRIEKIKYEKKAYNI